MIIKEFNFSTSIPTSIVEKAIKSKTYQYLSIITPSRILKIKNYLKMQLHVDIDIKDLFKAIIRYLTLTNIETNYQVILPENIAYKNFNLASLVRLLESGNLEIAKENLIYRAIDYACKSL